MIVRSFSLRGERHFTAFLDAYQNGEVSQDVAMDIALNNSLTESVSPQVRIDIPTLANKKELAKSVCDAFVAAGWKSLPSNTDPHVRRIWTWLAAVCFGHIRSRRANRRLQDYSFFIAGSNWNRVYRHRVAGPARTYWLFRRHPANANILLYGPAFQHSDFEEQITGRQDRYSNVALVSAANQLYWDANSGRPKRGAQTRQRPGTLRRFLNVMDQLDLTYDLHGISDSKILNLLPSEFDRWRQ